MPPENPGERRRNGALVSDVELVWRRSACQAAIRRWVSITGAAGQRPRSSRKWGDFDRDNGDVTRAKPA